MLTEKDLNVLKAYTGKEKPMSKFPKTLFVKKENDPNSPEDEWYLAENNIDQMAEVDEKILVGTYELKEVQEVESRAVVTKRTV